MNQAQVEELVQKVEKFLDEKDLDYTPSVSSHTDGEICVTVETWEVVDDVRGCAQEIQDLVQDNFLELDEKDTECHEMVMVIFTVDGFVEEDED